MTDDADGLGPLIEALYRARRPWREANREFMIRSHVLSSVQALESVHCKPDDLQHKQQNMSMYLLGMANLAALMTAGKSMQELELTRQHKLLEVMVQTGWYKTRGSYVWEYATIMRPEELAAHLDTWAPTVPKGAWTLYSKFRVE